MELGRGLVWNLFRHYAIVQYIDWDDDDNRHEVAKKSAPRGGSGWKAGGQIRSVSNG